MQTFTPMVVLLFAAATFALPSSFPKKFNPKVHGEKSSYGTFKYDPKFELKPPALPEQDSSYLKHSGVKENKMEAPVISSYLIFDEKSVHSPIYAPSDEGAKIAASLLSLFKQRPDLMLSFVEELLKNPLPSQ